MEQSDNSDRAVFPRRNGFGNMPECERDKENDGKDDNTHREECFVAKFNPNDRTDRVISFNGHIVGIAERQRVVDGRTFRVVKVFRAKDVIPVPGCAKRVPSYRRNLDDDILAEVGQ